MPPHLRILPPGNDRRVEELLDAAFQRPARESRLAHELARGYPAFDPGLALLAEVEGEALGWALFVPRELRIRGAWVRTAVAAPLGVLPHARRRGIGRFLHACALPALRDRGIRAAIVISSAEFYAALGYESAFNVYAARVPVAILPAEEREPEAWIGLASRHLADLCEIQQACYAEIDGSERRFAAAIDWEGATEGAHTLVLERAGRVDGYVRFRLRAAIEVPECGVRTQAAIEPLLALLRRLAREHRNSQLELHLAPPHPVARELFLRGAVLESSNLGGASLMKVVDWPGTFRDTSASWIRALERCRRPSISLEVDGAIHRLTAKRGKLVIGDERDPHQHLWVPPERGAGLLTGQYGASDLLFDARVRERSRLYAESIELLHDLFPLRSPMWTYSPVFEIADE